jgi:hypothetical protein
MLCKCPRLIAGAREGKVADATLPSQIKPERIKPQRLECSLSVSEGWMPSG